VIVACNRYERDNGALPASLELLIPQYIASVPVDPYDGQPFRYDPARAIVYSVGEDGKDDGGKEIVASSGNSDIDQVYAIHEKKTETTTERKQIQN